MQIILEKPEFEKFVREQVDGGQYSSPSAVIEAALSRLMIDEFAPGELDRLIEAGEASLIHEPPRRLDEVFSRLEQKSAAMRAKISK